jgi:hypothetical protein
MELEHIIEIVSLKDKNKIRMWLMKYIGARYTTMKLRRQAR